MGYTVEYSIETRSAARRAFVDEIMPSIIKQLGLKRSKAGVLITFKGGIADLGMAIPLPGMNFYMVVINSRCSLRDAALTLSHEMVHVAQMAKGVLRCGPRGTTIWAGKVYPKRTPYMERPWELQAFAQQEIIMRRAIEAC